MDIRSLVRENIRDMEPYSSARDEFMGPGHVLLDANENPYNTGLNRYPDPHQNLLKRRIASLKKVDPDNIFLGNGSDEAIDLLLRGFCQPGVHKIIEMPPTYGMYRVSAEINEVEVVQVNLDNNFQPQVDKVLAVADQTTRMLFVCSPNNPTGNLIDPSVLRELINRFPGIVVVDEAYIDFASQDSIISWIPDYQNLVVLQTFSKAWGLAGLRLGMAFATVPIQQVLAKIKAPYNLSSLTQEKAMEAIEDPTMKEGWISKILSQRDWLKIQLEKLSMVEVVYPSDTNFLLVKFTSAQKVYQYLLDSLIVVRDRSQAVLCDDCLRITVGIESENKDLIDSLKKFKI